MMMRSKNYYSSYWLCMKEYRNKFHTYVLVFGCTMCPFACVQTSRRRLQAGNVPIESGQREPNVVNPFRVDNWVDLENLQHRTESIVNGRQPHRGQLFSVRVYDPGQ